MNVDRFGLQSARVERKKHVQRLNFELPVIERALQSAVDAGFRERVDGIHHDEAAVRAQQRAAAQIHEIGIPAAASIVTAMNRSEKIRVCWDRFENHRALIVFAVRQNHVHAVNAKRIAIGTLRARTESIGRRGIFGFAFAFLERIEIIEHVMPNFLKIFGDLRAGIFFLELFDHAVHQHRSRFLFEVAHLAAPVRAKAKASCGRQP